MKELSEWLNRAGWNPDCPDADCAAAISRPVIFDRWLSKADAAGAHWLLVQQEYVRKLDRAPFHEAEKQAAGWVAATYVILGTEQPGVALDSESVPRRYHELAEWFHQVLVPQMARYTEVVQRMDPDYFEREMHSFLAAGLLNEAEADRRFFPRWHEDAPRMALGIAMNDQGCKNPKGPIPALDFHTHMGYSRMLMDMDPKLATYDADGVARINPQRVREALDRIHRTRPPGRLEFRDELPEVRDEQAEAALEAVDHAEIVERLRRAEAGGPVRGRQQRAAQLVRENFDQLASGALTFRKLARTTGADRTALSEAFKAERERRRKRA